MYNKYTEIITDVRYMQYFLSFEESWCISLDAVKVYIDLNNKRPSCTDTDKVTRQLGQWITDQQRNYKKRQYIMKTDEIYNKYTEFITDVRYMQYFKNMN